MLTVSSVQKVIVPPPCVILLPLGCKEQFFSGVIAAHININSSDSQYRVGAPVVKLEEPF